MVNITIQTTKFFLEHPNTKNRGTLYLIKETNITIAQNHVLNSYLIKH